MAVEPHDRAMPPTLESGACRRNPHRKRGNDVPPPHDSVSVAPDNLSKVDCHELLLEDGRFGQIAERS